MNALVDPFQPVYMQRAWFELALLAIPAGALGTFVVLRRLAFATHALGVGTFPGAVIALALGASVFLGGLAAAAVMAVLLALLQLRRDIDAAAATGLILAGALALGSLLVSDLVSASARVDTLLFGSLLGVVDADLARSGAVAALVTVAVLVLGRGWLVVAFDRENARTLGFRPGLLDLALFGLLALAVVATVDAVGSLLAATFLLVPAATMRLFTRRLVPLVVSSIALALAVGTAGLWLAFHLDAPPGATVAAVSATVFAAAFVTRSITDGGRRGVALAGSVAVVALAFAGCGGSESDGAAPTPTPAETAALTGEAPAAQPVKVVATTGQVADWARAVGGDHIEVTQLLKPLVDPHEFEPTPSDADAVASADVALASGAGLDEWIDGLVENAGGGAELVEVAPTEKLKPGALNEGEELDPHFWHDPTLAIEAVNTIEQTLAAADPANAEAYAANADAYVAQIEALDAELKTDFDSVPTGERKLVTDHDAFGYLADRYGITVVGAAIPSTSTAAEPNAKELAELVETIRAEGVCSVFSERSVDPKLIEQIAAESGATVRPDLFGDTLGPEGSGAATYLEMMRHNAQVLVDGFSCS